jgi:hypothetical protein
MVINLRKSKSKKATARKEEKFNTGNTCSNPDFYLTGKDVLTTLLKVLLPGLFKITFVHVPVKRRISRGSIWFQF